MEKENKLEHNQEILDRYPGDSLGNGDYRLFMQFTYTIGDTNSDYAGQYAGQYTNCSTDTNARE